jgi:hypothetical protein
VIAFIEPAGVRHIAALKIKKEHLRGDPRSSEKYRGKIEVHSKVARQKPESSFLAYITGSRSGMQRNHRHKNLAFRYPLKTNTIAIVRPGHGSFHWEIQRGMQFLLWIEKHSF